MRAKETALSDQDQLKSNSKFDFKNFPQQKQTKFYIERAIKRAILSKSYRKSNCKLFFPTRARASLALRAKATE